MNNALQTAIEGILAPLTRLLIGRGFSFGMTSELLKAAFVREAIKSAPGAEEKFTDSRISVMTGIHRKDVKRLKSLGSDQLLRRPPVTSQVIGAWLSNPDLRSADDRPPSIPRKKKFDSELDFDDLVAGVSKDVRPRVVLEELLNRKIVRLTTDDRVELFADRLLHELDDETLAGFLGMNIHDHLSAAVSNYLRDRAPQLERNVFHQGLSEEAIALLAKSAEKLAMQVLQQLNEEAHRLANDQRFRGDRRFNCGIYFFSDKNIENATSKSKS